MACEHNARKALSGLCGSCLENENERLREKLETHDKFAELCYWDYGFWGNGSNDVPEMCLLLNDVFLPGADAMALTPEQVSQVHEIAKQGDPEHIWKWAKAALEGGE